MRWILASIVVLGSARAPGSFVFAGIAVETLGLVLVVRSHLIPREEKR